MIFNIKETYLALLSLCLLACASNSLANEDPVVKESVDPENKIAFLTFRITKNSDTEDLAIKLLAKKYTKGTLKKKRLRTTGTNTDKLICNLLNDNNIVTTTSVIDNPLIKNIEYLNEEQQFEKKRIVLDSTDFTIRLFAKKGTKFVSIASIEKHSKDTVQLFRAVL